MLDKCIRLLHGKTAREEEEEEKEGGEEGGDPSLNTGTITQQHNLLNETKHQVHCHDIAASPPR